MAIAIPVQTAPARTTNKASTSLATTLPAAPTPGNLLVTALAVDKKVTNPVPPAGFILGPSWAGTAGTGLAWAYKVAATGAETGALTWTWDNAAGAAAVIAEFPVVSATFVAAEVNGSESNTASLSATAPAAGAGGGLHVGFAAVDTAGDGISPATWPVPGGPSWSGLTQVALQLGTISPDNGGTSVAAAAASAAAGSTLPVTMSYSGSADQNALIVATFTGSERGETPTTPTGSAVGTWTLTGVAVGVAPAAQVACTGAEVGAVTATGAVLAFDLASTATARAVLSLTSDLASPIFGTPATGKVAKSAVTGLTAGIRWYWGVEIDGALAASPRGSFRTAPPGPASFQVVLGSCAGQNTSPYIVDRISGAPTFEAMRNVDADLFLHMGDRHYGDLGNVSQATYVAKNSAVRATPRQAALHNSLTTVYHPDDHDGPGNNWGSGTSGAATALAAWDQAIPHYPVAVPGTWAHSFVWGRARFVILDARSKRAAGTILGSDQLAWATNLIATSTERLLVIDTNIAWIGDGVTGSDASDSWGAYGADRQQIAAAITAARSAGRDVLLVAGDAHMVAVDDGTNSQYDPAATGAGPVVFQAAPFDATSSIKGGPYSAGTFTQSRYQFGVLDVVDTGTQLTATVTGYTTSTADPYPATAMVSRTVTAPPRGTATGAWTASGAAIGSSSRRGAGSGGWAAAGSATGAAPVLTVPAGAATGAWGTTGTSVGARAAKGAATGTTLWAATAVGTTPVVGRNDGTAFGTASWAGTATGYTARRAQAAGGVAWTGAGAGKTARTGGAAATTTWTGTATGRIHTAGTAVGGWLYIGAARSGDTSSLVAVWTGNAWKPVTPLEWTGTAWVDAPVTITP